ncbi:MAG: hypothetical protein SFX72_22215 [Isosphaeraceae bacterium]|nr:hypothetical protein [Isosphaeraceae bacterium]
MEQLYYTQCPTGYGLGASSGFQIKRISPGFPLRSDFRYLGMRAYPSGGRQLAPATLRYRLVEDAAEIAMLTPRTFEYETERGLWGRPGGIFAHAVRLETSLLDSLENWVAGLQDSRSWVRSDPTPTRGREPEPLQIGPDDLVVPPRFESIAPRSVGLQPDAVAAALAATAIAVRENRTVYLIDQQEHLADRVGLITFAFPRSMRRRLTFSTFHDRPEELPGYRIQGTTSRCVQNRAALLAQGIIVDLATGRIEPRIEIPEWATLLASWFIERGPEHRRAWELAQELSDRVAIDWSDTSLDALFSFPTTVEGRLPSPRDDSGWIRLAERAAWFGEHGRAEQWCAAIGPHWWPHELDSEPAREALLAVLRMPEAWITSERVRDWASTTCRVWSNTDISTRVSALTRIIRDCPISVRGSYLRAVTSLLDQSSADSLIQGLQVDPTNASSLLPIRAATATRDYLATGRSENLVGILKQTRRIEGATAPVLDALAQTCETIPGAIDRLAADLAQLFLNHDESRTWAIRRGKDAVLWLAPALRPVLAVSGNREAWNHLSDRVEASDRPAFARVFLELASDPVLGEDVFAWGIEHLLLTLPEAERPRDPRYLTTFLRRTKSDLLLIDAVFRSDGRRKAIRRWIRRAIELDEVPESDRRRIDRLHRLVRSLESGRASEILACSLEEVPLVDQPKMLGLILGRTRDDPGIILETAGRIWPEMHAVDSSYRGELGYHLARWKGLRELVGSPTRWVQRACWVVERLSPRDETGGRGLIGEILAATNQVVADPAAAWRLRRLIFEDRELHRCLRSDLARVLAEAPPQETIAIVAAWDRWIDKGAQIARFWEFVLNACDPIRASLVVERYADELRTIGRIDWWSAPDHGLANADYREAFARTAPMRPLLEDRLAGVQNWLQPPRGSSTSRGSFQGDGRTGAEADAVVLSSIAQDRRICIESLSKLFRQGLDSKGRGWAIFNMRGGVPLGKLDEEDRTTFIAWLIRAVDGVDDLQLAPIAKWIDDSGFRNPDRLKSWQAITDSTDLPHRAVASRDELTSSLIQELKRIRSEDDERAAIRSRPFRS